MYFDFPFSLTRSVHIDLIRHGKNHHAVRQQDASDPLQHQQVQYNQPQRQQRDHTQHQQQQQQPIPRSTVTSPYQEHVEFIVQEEREAKSKMPAHKGLEDYKLLDKMGE